MEPGPASWQLPPGPVRRQLKRVAGDDVTAADFLPDEADQLRLWKESQAQQSAVDPGRHRAGRGGLRRKRRGQHR